MASPIQLPPVRWRSRLRILSRDLRASRVAVVTIKLLSVCERPRSSAMTSWRICALGSPFNSWICRLYAAMCSRSPRSTRRSADSGPPMRLASESASPVGEPVYVGIGAPSSCRRRSQRWAWRTSASASLSSTDRRCRSRSRWASVRYVAAPSISACQFLCKAATRRRLAVVLVVSLMTSPSRRSPLTARSPSTCGSGPVDCHMVRRLRVTGAAFWTVAVERLGAAHDLIAGELRLQRRGSCAARQGVDAMAAQADRLGMLAHVGVEAHAPVAGVDAPQLAPGHQFVERLVHRGQREMGKPPAEAGMQLLRRGMGRVALQRAVDKRALDRHLAARGMDAPGQYVQIAHATLGPSK